MFQQPSRQNQIVITIIEQHTRAMLSYHIMRAQIDQTQMADGVRQTVTAAAIETRRAQFRFEQALEKLGIYVDDAREETFRHEASRIVNISRTNQIMARQERDQLIEATVIEISERVETVKTVEAEESETVLAA
jgi:hypothetical protein